MTLRRFWEVEEVPSVKFLSREDKQCEDHFTSTHIRDKEGKFVLRLPFRSSECTLGDSSLTALRRLYGIERRFSKVPELKQHYQKFMKEYESLGHMTHIGHLALTSEGHRVSLTSSESVQPDYFIPHHAVVKEESISTKVRVVFDASSKSTNGQSLNDLLLPGPKLQKEIFDIVLNFRSYPVAVTADVCKMFRQVVIDPVDRKYQCILWRNSVDDPVSVYELNTVTYGLASSPFQALRTLQQLALDEGNKFPWAAQAILNDVFVDDIVTGTETVADAQLLKTQLVELLAAGGFELHKWCSNRQELLEGFQPETDHSSEMFGSDSVKVLGIRWDPVQDKFLFKVNIPDLPVTKRGILSTIARLYDPCGWVAPVVTSSKMMLQTLWTQGLDWDEPVGEEVFKLWTRFKDSLPSLSEVAVSRFVPVQDQNVQFHGFCDASEKAYAAVIYARCVKSDGVAEVHLLVAKSRVAPLKTLSIPRLELCAAALLCKLWQCVVKLYYPKVGNLVLNAWTDSTVVLAWLRLSPHNLKTFVANRVAEIQSSISPSFWRHVPSEHNPADVASRGSLPDQLVKTIWFSGPFWLSQPPETWPVQHASEKVPVLEVKPVTSSVLVVQNNQWHDSDDPLGLLRRLSSYSKLQRVMAWILRAKAIFCNLPHPNGIFQTTEELSSARTYLVKVVQAHYFREEIRALEKGEPCSKAIRSLAPFLDSQGVVRVGGRLHNAPVSEYSKHPVLLPKQSRLSELIVMHCHVINLHVGPSSTLYLTRREYWITAARSLIRKLIHKCVSCFKVNAASSAPLMGTLPRSRFARGKAFCNVGVDFGGPFLATPVRTRRNTPHKVYLCLFICMVTKAVHLELVTDLSAAAFLAALKRFVAIRGLPSEICSDNGTNLVGARNYLKEVYTSLFSGDDKQQILMESAQKGIKWRFSPPASPHFGGLWEAAIKSVKQHMKRVVGTQILTFEELGTLFAQISAVLNSRPLCAMSDDPQEYNVLTPGHFLVGDALVALPDYDILSVPENRLDRWERITQFQQRIWKRWSNEYLHTLQQRSKWTTSEPNIQVDQLVLLKELNLPPLKWKTARVTAVHPGQDGIVRVVSLRTPQGSFTRAVTKVCRFPQE